MILMKPNDLELGGNSVLSDTWVGYGGQLTILGQSLADGETSVGRAQNTDAAAGERHSWQIFKLYYFVVVVGFDVSIMQALNPLR